MLNNEDIKFSRYFKHENIPIRMFLEYFKGLTKVTQENCCYGYQVTMEKQNRK